MSRGARLSCIVLIGALVVIVSKLDGSLQLVPPFADPGRFDALASTGVHPTRSSASKNSASTVHLSRWTAHPLGVNRG